MHSLTCSAFVPSSAINLGSPPCSRSAWWFEKDNNVQLLIFSWCITKFTEIILKGNAWQLVSIIVSHVHLWYSAGYCCNCSLHCFNIPVQPEDVLQMLHATAALADTSPWNSDQPLAGSGAEWCPHAHHPLLLTGECYCLHLHSPQVPIGVLL